MNMRSKFKGLRFLAILVAGFLVFPPQIYALSFDEIAQGQTGGNAVTFEEIYNYQTHNQGKVLSADTNLLTILYPTTGISEPTAYNTYIYVQTTNPSTCRIATTNVAYSAMGLFTNTSNSIFHIHRIEESNTTGSRTYYLACKDDQAGDITPTQTLQFTLTAATNIVNMQAIAHSPTSMQLTWPDPSASTVNFKVYRATSATGSGTLLGTTGYTYWVDANLTPDTTYYYYVIDHFASGDQPASAYIPGHTLPVTTNSNSAPNVVLDNFEQGNRITNPANIVSAPSTGYLWWNNSINSSAYAGCSITTTAATSAVAFEGTKSLQATETSQLCTGGPAQGGVPYIAFDPFSPNNIAQRAKEYIVSGNWQPDTYNRLRFWIKVPQSYAQTYRTNGSQNAEIGTYVKSSQSIATGSSQEAGAGGTHYYHNYDIPYIGGNWYQVIVDTHPTHQRGAPGFLDWGDTAYPTGEPGYNYFDALGRFYFDMGPYETLSGYPADFYVDDFEFYKDPNPENIDQVSGLSGGFDPAANKLYVNWSRKKTEDTVKHDVRYSFNDFYASGSGWNQGTAAPSGTIIPSGSGYNMAYTSTQIDVTGHSTLYIAIKPQNASTFNQIAIPLNGGSNIILPTISGVTSSTVAATTAIISWNTNVATDGQIQYGVTSSYGSQSAVVNSAGKTTSHTVTLTGLSPATTYHFRAASVDAGSNTVISSDSIFTTLILPVVNNNPPNPGATSTPEVLPPSLPVTATTTPIVVIPTINTTTPTSLSSLKIPSTQTGLINDRGTFYLVSAGQRRGITNPDLLYSYGLTFAMAKPASAEDLALPQAANLSPANGALVKSDKNSTVWLISNGQRHGFTSAKVFTDLGFRFTQVLTVTDPELYNLLQGDNLSDSAASHRQGLDTNDQGTIYWIDSNNIRHPYPSLEIFNSWRVPNDFSKVAPANAADKALPVGEAVTLRVLK